jgi:hypothetical protein
LVHDRRSRRRPGRATVRDGPVPPSPAGPRLAPADVAFPRRPAACASVTTCPRFPTGAWRCRAAAPGVRISCCRGRPARPSPDVQARTRGRRSGVAGFRRARRRFIDAGLSSRRRATRLSDAKGRRPGADAKDDGGGDGHADVGGGWRLRGAPRRVRRRRATDVSADAGGGRALPTRAADGAADVGAPDAPTARRIQRTDARGHGHPTSSRAAPDVHRLRRVPARPVSTCCGGRVLRETTRDVGAGGGLLWKNSGPGATPATARTLRPVECSGTCAVCGEGGMLPARRVLGGAPRHPRCRRVVVSSALPRRDALSDVANGPTCCPQSLYCGSRPEVSIEFSPRSRGCVRDLHASKRARSRPSRFCGICPRRIGNSWRSRRAHSFVSGSSIGVASAGAGRAGRSFWRARGLGFVLAGSGTDISTGAEDMGQGGTFRRAPREHRTSPRGGQQRTRKRRARRPAAGSVHDRRGRERHERRRRERGWRAAARRLLARAATPRGVGGSTAPRLDRRGRPRRTDGDRRLRWRRGGGGGR